MFSIAAGGIRPLTGSRPFALLRRESLALAKTWKPKLDIDHRRQKNFRESHMGNGFFPVATSCLYKKEFLG